MQAVILHDLPACETNDVRRNLCANTETFADGLQRARRPLGKRKSPCMGHPHREQVRSYHPLRTLDDEPALQGPHIPGDLDVGGSTLTSRSDTPLVVEQIGIASAGAV